ncbi:MAG TPA: HNH endonuclease [Anaerolineae bacterium]|nr:HNH endonuclease [Anaerolineae bacterium]
MTPRQLRQRIAPQARYRCGYCQIQESVSGIPLTLEHIVPRALGGKASEDNLWLSCRLCNEAKGIAIDAVDPASGEPVALFNPRVQNWADRFRWNSDGTHIVGLTSIGRATVDALDLNSELRGRARAIWVEAGYHPPK